MKTFASRLLRARHARGLSQKALARASGLSQSAIASYENGTRKSAKGIFRLAQVLQVDPAWLSMGLGKMELTPHQADPNIQYVSDADTVFWPFQAISPRDYQSLSLSDRQIIEAAVNAMVQSMRNPRL
ncbi:MAG: helix-turn-helix transcriptional regulator [Alcaligenaceae bacterium]|nr:helix-turn-helix transcriptional regulator [Alcaligenaceae bacterium]